MEQLALAELSPICLAFEFKLPGKGPGLSERLEGPSLRRDGAGPIARAYPTLARIGSIGKQSNILWQSGDWLCRRHAIACRSLV
jgi:hypothetical protein